MLTNTSLATRIQTRLHTGTTTPTGTQTHLAFIQANMCGKKQDLAVRFGAACPHPLLRAVARVDIQVNQGYAGDAAAVVPAERIYVCMYIYIYIYVSAFCIYVCMFT